MSSLIQSAECIKGWTDPKGTIVIERGTRLSIKCAVESDELTNKKSTLLGFHNNTANEDIDRRYINIINDTAIELVIPKATEQDSMLVCKYNGTKGIMYNDIKVGHKPDIIRDLECTSFDWVNLTCTFTKPYNPVFVQYELKYNTPSSGVMYNCQDEKKAPGKFECVFSDSYRRFHPHFTFYLYSNNLFGSRNQTFDFDNFANIIPSRVDDLRLVPETSKSDSITIAWYLPSKLTVLMKQSFSFDFEISINSSLDCGAGENKILLRNFSAIFGTTSRKNEDASYQYTIPVGFANKWYDIGVRMKVSKAENKSKMWSDFAKIQAFTSARAPDDPPKIDVGSFNILPNGDVYIYWKHLSTCEQNGNEFGYSIKSSNRQEAPSEHNQIYAVYRRDLNNLSRDTVITIRSKNSVGESAKASTLIIPGNSRRLNGPTKINKKSVNGKYILSWSPPEKKNEEEITSYTVFWCNSKTELINQCENSIEFVRRSPHETTFEYDSDQPVNFAISANSETSTSGMMWAKCTTANSNEIGKIRTARISRLSSKEIEVEWNLDCTDSGIVAGYQIEYCPISKPKTLECIAGSENRTNITTQVDHTKFTLTGLKPYTTYKIIIRMFSNSTMGPPSEPLANTTLEDAPSEVRNLLARNVGNTTVDLYWEPPEHPNGIIGSYEIWKNGERYYQKENPKVPYDNEHTIETIQNYTLTGLDPYTDYEIVVRACTNKCSNGLNTHFKTTIGAPGPFEKQPINNFSGKFASGIISWSQPKVKGGHLDFYELRTTFSGSGDALEESIVKLKSKECFMENLCMNNLTGTFHFSVRAVNFVLTPHAKNLSFRIQAHNSRDHMKCANDEELLESISKASEVDQYGYYLYGPWSDASSHTCHFSNFNSKQYIIIMILMVASLVFVVMVFYLYRRIKDMKDILVQMPPGLEDLQSEKAKKGKDLNTDKVGKPDLLHNIGSPYIMNEDEHGRLLKRSMNGSINGADCSSSMHSESSRSEIEPADIDDIEYNDFGQQNNTSDAEADAAIISRRPQSFIMNSSVPKEIAPILISPESISASTPVAEKFNNPNAFMHPKTPPNHSGYIAPPVLHSTPVPQINSNGYVTHSMLNPMQSSGYTQLNALGKPILNNDRNFIDKLNLKTPIVATTDQEGISGYVTHKQLKNFNEFGQRMQ